MGICSVVYAYEDFCMFTTLLEKRMVTQMSQRSMN